MCVYRQRRGSVLALAWYPWVKSGVPAIGVLYLDPRLSRYLVADLEICPLCRIVYLWNLMASGNCL